MSDDVASAPEPTVVRPFSVFHVRVRLCETDLMAVVHHGRYVPYLEAARIEYLRRRGISYKQLSEQNVHMPVVELGLRYLRPARFDEELTIETTLAAATRVTVRFEYAIRRAGELLCTGHTLLACVDDAMKPRRIAPELLAALERFEGEPTQL